MNLDSYLFLCRDPISFSCIHHVFSFSFDFPAQMYNCYSFPTCLFCVKSHRPVASNWPFGAPNTIAEPLGGVFLDEELPVELDIKG